MPKIQFLTNEANKVEGLQYAGFETFKGSPYRSCARETGQNSRDAASGSGVVKVAFKLHDVPRDQLPFADELSNSIGNCLNAPQDEKTRKHLERALATITASLVKVLEISDRNTTGLTGPINDPTSVFAALVKGDGVTNKSIATSAGSFGIGKNAAFAVSSLQMIIYSTCYMEGGAKRFAAQGRLRLISHSDGANKYSAEGYWGNDSFMAIEDPHQVPAWLRRDEIGTSIFSIGFREEDHWDTRMALALATNFFLAIDRRQIEFSVADTFKLTNSSIYDVLHSATLASVAAESDQSAELERASLLLDCVRSPLAHTETIPVNDLGDFELTVLVAEELPKEVHILRNGIYITDNFKKLSEPMVQFPSTREFVAILEPAQNASGDIPSALLKQLENPEHNSFEPERIVDPADQQKAKKQIKSLISDVRKYIRSVARVEDVNNSQLDELSHLFANLNPGSDKSKDDGERNPEGFRYGVARQGIRNIKGNTPGRGKNKTRGHDTGALKMVNRGNNKSKSETRVQQAIELEGIRSRFPIEEKPTRRTIFFTPSHDAEISIKISAAGLYSDVDLNVVNTSLGKMKDGNIQTHAKKGERIQMEVEFSEPFEGPIEVSASPTKSTD